MIVQPLMPDFVDPEFFKRVTRLKNFNLRDQDFGKKNLFLNKKTIRFLYNTIKLGKKTGNIFNLAVKSMQLGSSEVKTINDLGQAIKRMDKTAYEDIISYKANKLGPGEVMIYLCHDNVHLAGGTESGDVRIETKQYEVKGAVVHKAREKDNPHNYKIATNFYFGTEVRDDPLVKSAVSEMLAAKERHKKDYNKKGIKSAKTGSLGIPETKYLSATYADFRAAEVDYAKHAVRVINSKQQKFVFVNNNKGTADYGKIEKVKTIKAEDISVREHTGMGTSPRIKI